MLTEKESLSEKFVRKGFWLYLFSFIIGPLGYITKVIISRDLSVEEVGMVYGVISFVTFLSMYNDLGCSESMLYYLPKLIVKKDFGRAKYIISLVLRVQLLTSALIYIILYFVAPWLASNYFKADVISLLQIAGLFFIGINLMHISTAILQSAQDTKLSKGAELVRLLATAIGVSFLFFTDEGDTEKYMMAWVLGLGVGVIFSGLVTWKKYYLPFFNGIKIVQDISLRKHFMKYSLATLFAGNIGAVLSQVDMQLIIYFLGTKDAGYYSTYLSVIGIPFIILAPIIAFLFPVISELSGRENTDKIRLVVTRFWIYFSILGLWAGFFMFQFAEVITVLFFGEKFRLSGQILQFSAPFIIFNFLAQIASQVLAGTGEIKKRTKILTIILFTNIILNIIFIPLFGVQGAAIAVGLSWIPLFYLSQKASGIPFNFFLTREFWINLCTGGIAYIICQLLFQNIHISNFITIVIALLLYMSIFTLANYTLIREGIETLRQVKKNSL